MESLGAMRDSETPILHEENRRTKEMADLPGTGESSMLIIDDLGTNLLTLGLIHLKHLNRIESGSTVHQLAM